MKKMNRVFRHYEDLEEYHAGMWRILTGDERKRNIAAARDLMKTPETFKSAMLRATLEWPMSCEVALTAESTNRIAWLGHAGCCIETGSPEECTRAGWHELTKPEQDEANRVAIETLILWQDAYIQKATPTFFELWNA